MPPYNVVKAKTLATLLGYILGNAYARLPILCRSVAFWVCQTFQSPKYIIASKGPVDNLMEIQDISRSSAYILIKKNFFRSVRVGNQLRISKASFDEWLDKG